MVRPLRIPLFAIPLALLVSCAQPDEPQGSTEAPVEASEDLDSVRQMQAIEGVASAERVRLDTLEERFEARTGQPLPSGLTAPQDAVLSELLAAEQDPDLESLLQAIVESRERIAELEDQMLDLAARLPTPSVVAEGDTHFDLAVAWLVENEGFVRGEAESIVGRTLLADRLEPGMEVWHFFEDPTYASAVTQGSAKHSPYALMTRWVRSIEGERDVARARAAGFEQRVERLELEATDALARADEAVDHADRMKRQREALAADAARFSYQATSGRDLRRSGVVPPVGLRLTSWRPELFDRALDTRHRDFLTVRADEVGLRRIRQLELLPRYRWTRDLDYRVAVSRDGSSATVFLLEPAAFADEAAFVVAR